MRIAIFDAIFGHNGVFSNFRRQERLQQQEVSILLRDAAQRNDWQEVTRILDNSKVRLNLEQTDGLVGTTVLHYASVAGEVNIVRKLIEAGVDVNIQDSFGKTSLHHIAVEERITPGMLEVARMLIEAGADVDLKDFSGDEVGATALIYARENGHKELAELLYADSKLLQNAIA